MTYLPVPKPLTSGVPLITHTPYNVAQGQFNSNQQAFGEVPPPANIGQVLSQYMPQGSFNTPTGLPKSVTNKQSIPAPSSLYSAPNPNNVQKYLQTLMTGGSIDTKTGWMGSKAQAMGKAGGSGFANYVAHKGILDPASAQFAQQQFQQNLGSGQYQPGNAFSGNIGGWTQAGPATPGLWGGGFSGGSVPNPSMFFQPQQQQPTNYYNPQYSQPGSMTVSSKNYRNY